MIAKAIFGLSIPALLFSETLNELIDLSLKNKNIASSKVNIEAIKEEYKSIKKSYLPSLSIGGDYRDYSHETAGTPNNYLDAYAKITYNLYDGGNKKLRYKSYESQIETSKKNLLSLKNQVALVIVQHYFNYLSQVSAKEAKIQEIEQLNAQYSRLKKFLDAGTTTIDELDRIISNVESANVELHQLNLDIQTILHELEYMTGKKVSIVNGSFINDNNEKAQLRSDIKALKQEMQTRLIEAKSVKTSNKPHITLSDTFTYYDYNYNNSTYQDASIEKQNVLNANVEWKIFDFGSNKAAYNAAYKSFLSSKLEYEYERNRAITDLNLAQKSYDIAKLKIKSAQAGLKAAISTYDITKNQYKNGLVDNISYLSALTDKFDAQSALSSAKNSFEISKATLMYQKGKNIWEYIK